MTHASFTQPSWFAVYTHPRAERKVYNKVVQMGLQAYLPVQKVVHQWSDRKKEVEVPLFASYVFVKTTVQARFDLFFIQGLMWFVSCEGIPVAIPESEIEGVRKLLALGISVCPEAYRYKAGDKVKISSGQFAGVEGYVIRQDGKDRLFIQVEALKQAISVGIPLHAVTGIAPLGAAVA
jgi:transcription antitermination factor NusG